MIRWRRFYRWLRWRAGSTSRYLSVRFQPDYKPPPARKAPLLVKDQVLAGKWVEYKIGRFGSQPNGNHGIMPIQECIFDDLHPQSIAFFRRNQKWRDVFE